ncbi:cation:proton antiporter [Companilactobacillus baiquanensis]|uniref:Cation:proton antiporter n=1 Tax=Companilactobacillus baiquanensis TaxID=2486005 RepID=A0ABW1UVD1_9LACO|nr:cation:proton antiporter [Companilactobacillus baiquanensis]
MEMYISTIVILIAVALSNFLAKFVSSISKTYISLLVGIVFAAIPLINGYILKFDFEFFMAFIIAPLLFLEGQKTRSILVRRKIKSIIGTAVVLALISAIAGLFAISQLFSLTLPFALILIAISTPTDATAMDSVSEGRKMPRRSEIVLKMESLFNDASGIILLQAGVIWFKTGHLSYARNFGVFILTAIGGALIGIIVAFIIMICRQMIIRTRFNVTYSHVIIYFATPILIYFAAEELRLSGIIAVVSAGLIFNGEMSRSRFSSPRYLSFFNQIVVFFGDTMNGFVFVILGLSLMRIVIEEKPELTSTLEWLWIGLTIYLVSLMVRYLYARFITRYDKMEAISFSLGGVHGAVTLALVFSLVGQGISTHLFNLILLTETVVIVFSMLTPTILFKFILDPVQNEDDLRMNKKLIREKMVNVGIEYVAGLQISPAVKESVTFDLLDQNRNTTLRQFLSQWLGVNSKRYVFTGFQAVEERQILMNAFEEERKYLYELVDGTALDKAKYIYDVYSELLISESLVLDSYEE